MSGFDSIYGNESAKETLKEIFLSGRIPHSYIISGEKGTGKRSMAYAYAKLLLCTSPSGAEPCGECRSCRKMEMGSHPDFFQIVSQSDRGAVSIGQIRAMADDCFVMPNDGDRKVYVVCGADKMRQDAQNAMLKTFEEPASFSYIILTASRESDLLPTVRSRAVSVEMNPISTDDVAKCLMERGYGRERAWAAAEASFGRVGRALEIADDQSDVIGTARRFTQLLMEGPELDFYLFARNSLSSKTDMDGFLEQVSGILRDGIITKKGIKGVKYLSGMSREELIGMFHGSDIGRLCEGIRITGEFRNRLMRYANFPAALMDYMCSCWEEIHG